MTATPFARVAFVPLLFIGLGSATACGDSPLEISTDSDGEVEVRISGSREAAPVVYARDRSSADTSDAVAPR